MSTSPSSCFVMTPVTDPINSTSQCIYVDDGGVRKYLTAGTGYIHENLSINTPIGLDSDVTIDSSGNITVFSNSNITKFDFEYTGDYDILGTAIYQIRISGTDWYLSGECQAYPLFVNPVGLYLTMEKNYDDTKFTEGWNVPMVGGYKFNATNFGHSGLSVVPVTPSDSVCIPVINQYLDNNSSFDTKNVPECAGCVTNYKWDTHTLIASTSTSTIFTDTLNATETKSFIASNTPFGAPPIGPPRGSNSKCIPILNRGIYNWSFDSDTIPECSGCDIRYSLGAELPYPNGGPRFFVDGVYKWTYYNSAYSGILQGRESDADTVAYIANNPPFTGPPYSDIKGVTFNTTTSSRTIGVVVNLTVNFDKTITYKYINSATAQQVRYGTISASFTIESASVIKLVALPGGATLTENSTRFNITKLSNGTHTLTGIESGIIYNGP